MAKVTGNQGLDSGVENTTNDEPTVATPIAEPTNPAIEQLKKFKTLAGEDLANQFRLLSISGDSSPELEKLLTDEYPLLRINRSDVPLTFHLSNGKHIKV